jgi:hypothetical protein
MRLEQRAITQRVQAGCGPAMNAALVPIFLRGPDPAKGLAIREVYHGIVSGRMVRCALALSRGDARRQLAVIAMRMAILA